MKKGYMEKRYMERRYIERKHTKRRYTGNRNIKREIQRVDINRESILGRGKQIKELQKRDIRIRKSNTKYIENRQIWKE